MELSLNFFDKRTVENGILFQDRMVERKTVCIKKLSNCRAEEVKFGRFLRNKTMGSNHLIREEVNRIKEVVSERHILALQDTTEINYESNSGRIKDLGAVYNGKDKGLFLHPTFLIDANTGGGIGFSNLYMWSRKGRSYRNCEELPIEEKESYRWLESAIQSKTVLSKASMVTFISDRESDIYEYLYRIPDEKTHLIVRSCARRILPDGRYASAYVDSEEEAGQLSFILPREIRRDRDKRIVNLSVHYSKVELKRPRKKVDRYGPKSLEMTMISVKELSTSENKTPIIWYLLTTHEIRSFEDAAQVIKWYRARWQIEQLFRTLKRRGLNIESSQITQEDSLKKLAVLAVNAAIRVMQLVIARDGKTEQSPSDLFDKNEIEFMEYLIPAMEGKTEIQKNPHQKNNLAWASWLIARLGGWKGYSKSESPPGPNTMRYGLERFRSMYDGWLLARNLCIG